MYMPTYTAIALLGAASGAHAWGVLGHATVAAIADHYLTAQAKTYVSGLLGSGVTMASVASWADEYRSTTAGKFSAPYHFIDAEDNPPTSCSVDTTRDCGTAGCVVTAIANYTKIVNDGRYSAAHRKEAAEFIIHFLGDVTQPLHDESELVGGNDIAVTWKGTKTNLHACWDTQMVEEAAGGENSTSVLEAFAAKLEASIDSGSYSSQKASWVTCVDTSTAAACALSWAQDANAYNCQYVLKTNETNQELSGAYYTGAVPIIELQLAKAGYRLASWLNALATQ